MRTTTFRIFLLFASLLFPTCQQPCDDSKTTDDNIYTEIQQVNKIDNHLYEFILSRLYVLSGDSMPEYNVIIEFAVRNKDTLFNMSLLSAVYRELLDDTKIGCITTDDFRLFVLDKDSLCSSYYQIDSIWPNPLPYNRSPMIWSVQGVVSNGLFFEKYLDKYDPKDEFDLYHSNSIR